MGDDGVTAVYDHGIISALVEHSEVHSEGGGVVHITADGTLVGRHDHKIIVVGMEIGDVFEKSLENLIGGHNVIEAHQGYGVLHAGVVRVEGDYAGNAHALKLLQHYCAVERFAICTAMLTATVEQRHNYADSVCLSADRLNDSLKILIVVVGRHTVDATEIVVGAAIVSDVDENEDVVTANGGFDQSLSVTRGKAGTLILDEEGVNVESAVTGPAYKVVVDLASELRGTFHRDQLKFSKIFLSAEYGIGGDCFCHIKTPVLILLYYSTFKRKLKQKIA